MLEFDESGEVENTPTGRDVPQEMLGYALIDCHIRCGAVNDSESIPDMSLSEVGITPTEF